MLSPERVLSSTLRVAAAAILINVVSAAPLRAECVDVRSAGAVGDGVADDTDAFQKAIKSATNSSHRGGTVCVSSGEYVISKTIVVDDVEGLRLIGQGGDTRLVWNGDDHSPLLLLSSVQGAEVSGFRIVARAAKPLAVAVQCITRQGATLVSKHNRFSNLVIDGITRGVVKGFQIGGSPGVDANNDFHVFENCVVQNYAGIAYSIENTQVYGLLFINSFFLGNASGQIGVASDQNGGKGGSFSWIGGGGSNNSIADFSLGDPNSGAIVITNAVFERSARFLRTGGPSGASFLLQVSGVRWSGDALADDGVAIDFRYPGPFVIRDSRIGEYSDKSLKISWRPGGSGVGVFIFEGNVVKRAQGAPLFVYRQPTRTADNIID